MNRPNFFLLGAPRCGTTSMASWLGEHPQIYMSPEKEPNFFNSDHRRYRTSLAAYERLFEPARETHLAVGEASVWYFYSTAAVPNILQYNPDAKFIVMLRNPVDMSYSLHDELFFTRHEDIADFATAWKLQEARRAGNRLPTLVWEPKFLQYGKACSLGIQLTRLYERVPSSRVSIVVMDDLRRDPRAVYRSVLSFLGVADDDRTEFSATNQAKVRRWPALVYLDRVAKSVKQIAGIEGGLGLARRIEAWNQTERRRRPLDCAFQDELRRYFEADICTLERLTGRDFTCWRQ
jgi:hypothetical protein